MMKKIMLLSLMVLLSGCYTYRHDRSDRRDRNRYERRDRDRRDNDNRWKDDGRKDKSHDRDNDRQDYYR